MTFKYIAKRLTGISIPVFGVQWHPKPKEILLAKAVVTFLEDKEVLYNPHVLESPKACLESVINIREYVTGQLEQVEKDSEIARILIGMSAACRKLTDTGSNLKSLKHGSRLHGMGDEMTFFSAIGELRGAMGFLLLQLLVLHGLGCSAKLAKILPLGE